jgi:transposase InsO family protein
MADLFRANITKLNNDNYSVWKFKMELLLMKEDLWSQVSTKKPADTTAATSWQKRDDRARATIGLLVEDSQLIHIRKDTTAKGAWESLKNYHEKSTLTSKVYLLRQICNLKLSETGNMEQHVTTMQDLVDKLTALGEEIKDHLLVAMLLSSLPETYSTLITALESRPDTELTLGFVKGKLIDEYKRRKGVPDSEDSSTALRASQKKNSVGESDRSCFFCKKSGHFKQDCFKYKKWKANNEKREKVNEVKDKNERSGSVCFSVHDRKNQKDVWYIDSGATSHMSNDESFFKTLEKRKMRDVTVANGESAKVLGIGRGELHCLNGKDEAVKVCLENVLYVPDLTENLLSVKRLAKTGHSVGFTGEQCEISKNNIVIAKGKLSPDMYELRVPHRSLAVKQNQHTPNCQHSWHRRFGHRHPEDVQKLEIKKMATGLKIQDCGIREVCECCIKGKMSRCPIPKKATTRATSVLELVHTDLCGPMQNATPSGKRYFMTMIDDYSRFTQVYFLKFKSEVSKFINEYIKYAENKFEKKVKVIRSDNGREYITKELQRSLTEMGIKVQYTAPYSAFQNGVAERKNRTLMEAARCMLIDAEIKKKYWAEAVNTACYLQNILPSKAVDKTPFELWNRRKPDVKHLHIFGCKGYAHLPKEKRRKLDEKAISLTFVGYSAESKAYRMLDTATDKITISRDVKIIERDLKREEENEKGSSQENKSTERRKIVENRDENTPESGQEVNYSEDIEIISENELENEQDQGLNESSESLNEFEETQSLAMDSVLEQSLPAGDEEYVFQGNLDDLNNQEVRVSERPTKGQPPDRFKPQANIVRDHEEPKNRTEALSGVDKHDWIRAMNEEMKALTENSTWVLTTLPEGRKTIGCKWVFKRKKNANTGLIKYKARLVAQGFSQKYGTDYDEVFAPVVRATTLRLLLAIATQRKLKIHHFDAKTAFLNGELKETIYMKQPEGFVDAKEELVCKLNKSIYGLKQAAKVWNEKLHGALTKLGFKQSTSDPCLYSKNKSKALQYVAVYVDDLLIADENDYEIEKTADGLEKEFDLTRLGELKSYLGINIQRDSNGVFYMDQAQYIQKTINRFGLKDARISATPLDTGYLKIARDGKPMHNGEKFQKLIGAVLYVATHTRPDIAASVSILSQKIKQPTETDWNEAKRIVRYLKGTKEFKLKLTSNTEGLEAYTDADWAEDRTDSKSHSGFVFLYNGSAIAWACRKQTCTAWSSCEAEYIAIAEASRELLWIRRLLEDFHIEQTKPIRIYEDNQSAIKLIKTGESRNKTKHIDVKYHFVTDLEKKKIIEIRYCPTTEMIADMMTKPLGAVKLKKHREACQLMDLKRNIN